MKLSRAPASIWCLCAALALTCALFPGRMGWGTYSSAGLVLVAAAGALCVIAIEAGRRSGRLSAPPLPARRGWRFWGVLFVLHLALGIFSVRITPAELTDVYLWQRDAAAALLHGTDPYTITHKDIFGVNSSYFYPAGTSYGGRVHIGLAYPPLSLLMILPGYLAGDLRYSDIAAFLLSAYIFFRLRPDWTGLLVTAILLLSPISFCLVSHGFSEPLVLFTLVCTVFAAQRQSRWLPVALAAFLSSKQYSLLALPFAGFLIPGCTWKKYVSLVAKASALAALICVPFAIWNFSHFWHDLVLLSFVVPFRPDSLSFSVLTAKLGWGSIPFPVVMAAVMAACTWCFVRASRSPAMFAACFSFALLVLLSLHRQAFVNYYFLVIGSLLAATVVADASCKRLVRLPPASASSTLTAGVIPGSQPMPL